MRRTATLVLLFLLSCAPNPYTKFYSGIPDARVRSGYVSTSEPLRIYTSDDFDRDVLLLMRRGYFLVGNSSFNAGMGAVKESQLRSQADLIGARVVLVSSRYTNTVSGALPLSVPNTTTTTSTGTATVVGSGGTATIVGNGTSTTRGSSTVMVPYSVARADFAALYLAPMRTRLGVYVVALDDTTRARLESNTGLSVRVVVDDSPAFNADILVGDILLDVNGERVGSADQFGAMLGRYDGRSVTILMNRDGRTLSKTVQLLSLP